VREQRERAGLTLGVTHQQVDQPGLEAQPRVVGWPLDRGAQRVAPQRAHQVEALLDQARQRRLAGDCGEMVGSHHHHDRRPLLGMCHQPRAERADGLRRRALGEEILELVDDEDRRGAVPRQPPGQGCIRIGTRHEDGDGSTPATECRRQAGAHRRGFPTSRRAGDRQQPARFQAHQAGAHIGLATEEAVGVGLVVGGEALVGTVVAGVR
jgi:hypothetical protein